METEEPKSTLLTDMTVVELKAAAFDLIAERDNLQQTINAVIAELQKRQREA